MLDRLDRLATGRNVLCALAGLLVLFTQANIVSTLFADAYGAGIIDLGGGHNILDPRPGLSVDGALTLVQQYGPDGRAAHLVLTLACDIVLPLTMFLFGALAVLHVLRRLGASERWRRSAVLLPLAYLVGDLGENAGIVTMLVSYPATLTPVASLTVALSTVKSVALVLTMLGVAGGYVAGALRHQASVHPIG